jgi:hypothetical protein
MIKIKKFFKTSMLTMLIVSFFTLAVYGREPGSYPVAEPRFSPSDIVWVPLVNYSFLDLTIARPDGTLFSRTFESGSTPYADLSDILGKANLDGSYIYELRAGKSAAKMMKSKSGIRRPHWSRPVDFLSWTVRL